MSEFNRNNQHTDQSNGQYLFDHEELEEVEVDDMIPESETESIWTDVGNDEEDMINDENIENSNEIDEDRPLAVDLSYATFLGHGKESVYCVAIHSIKPNIVITGGGDDNAYIWSYDLPNTETHLSESNLGQTKGVVTCLHTLSDHSDSITSVGFNFDGSLALTGSYDGTVKIWSVEDGSLKVTLDGPDDIDWAEWHSKGNAVIAGSKDGTVWMWLAHSGKCVQVFAGHDGGVSSGCFTSDGKMVCTGGEDGTVRVWVPKTGMCKITFEGTHVGHEGTVTCLVSSEDGDMILSGSVDGKVRLYQISGKRLLQTFVHCSPQSIKEKKITTASDTMASEGRSTSVRYLDGDIDANQDENEENEEMILQKMESILSVECVGFCPISTGYKWIASGGMDSYLKIWDMTTGTCRSMCKHNGSVVALKWHGTLPILATASLDNELRLWDARNGLLLSLFTGHNDILLALDFKSIPHPSSESQSDHSYYTDVIVTASDDGTAKVFPIDYSRFI